MAPSTESRASGAIWGVCVGDALGGPVQFMGPNTFSRVTELAFVKPFRKPEGSFIDSHGQYNHALAIQNFLDWIANGRFSTADSAWDIGFSTRLSLAIWQRHGTKDLPGTQQRVHEKFDRERQSGNGSLMRISSVGVVLWRNPELARQVARQQSQVTHPALACGEACELYTELVCGIMNGKDKEQLWQTVTSFPLTHPALTERLAQYKTIADWQAKPDADIRSSGWVVDTLEVAFWAFFKYDSWTDGVLAAVNLGGDADTAAAVYGGLAGVFYGYESIPRDWVDRMQNREMIRDIATKLSQVASQPQQPDQSSQSTPER
ncbi:ADP-ribosylation/Crystallin J1 [Penicillium alfredii]|uniref:ADP-ribosylhydrolase ARH3 n=1 Tax=Penicillium alfredii TaxID=1506179 RepID=A0A9W9ES71_9EURO|nr:ADP-ribosylation/Crystallin J1 [Penicillium alfredii]KAJ5086899.1 ADP-ribosylation/Crystallin J1 [Penicillium alfredii]